MVWNKKFFSKFLNFPEKLWRKRWRKLANADSFAFQANAIRQNKSLATCFAHNLFAFDFYFILERIDLSFWNIKDLNVGEKNLTNIRP